MCFCCDFFWKKKKKKGGGKGVWRWIYIQKGMKLGGGGVRGVGGEWRGLIGWMRGRGCQT